MSGGPFPWGEDSVLGQKRATVCGGELWAMDTRGSLREWSLNQT